MSKESTMHFYFKTQIIDFAFILSVILAGYTLWCFVANLHPRSNFFRNWGNKFAYALPLAGAFDILENVVSFFMIANPENFADVLILPYSTFAVLKFACWTIGLIWLLIALVALPFTSIIFNKRLSTAEKV